MVRNGLRTPGYGVDIKCEGQYTFVTFLIRIFAMIIMVLPKAYYSIMRHIKFISDFELHAFATV